MLLLIPTLSEAALLMGAEAARPLAAGGAARWSLAGQRLTVALCGFGLAAAGAGAGYWLGRRAGKPGNERVVLAGLAGALDPRRAPVGSALIVTGAACDGIGFGLADGHRGAQAAGWLQGHAAPGLPAVGDALQWPLAIERARLPPGARVGQALTVAAASSRPEEAARRAAAYPDASIEDMETFAVALAARLAGAPLLVVRGVGNLAGDRDASRWRSQDAMDAVRALLVATIARERPATATQGAGAKKC
jgi:futalosine hydrolase